MTRAQYEILIGDTWTRVKGQPETRLGRAFLRYQLRKDDSITNGLARPGTWREIDRNERRAQ